MARLFRQIDVFGAEPLCGNPVAVVLDADGIDDHALQRLARWTNLSETTFVLPPQASEADYRVRIFTPDRELPFAGHPTLGTCHAWLEAGGNPHDQAGVVQECGAGLIRIKQTQYGLAFAAPPLVRSEPVEEELVVRLAEMLGITRAEIVDSQWVDNGPGWVAVLLHDAQSVLALRPTKVDLELGVIGPYPAGGEAAFEVRAFFPVDGATVEDPVTGSLNASLAQWMIESGRVRPPYTASQGTALGRRGRVQLTVDGEGTIWVAGSTVTCITGELAL